MLPVRFNFLLSVALKQPTLSPVSLNCATVIKVNAHFDVLLWGYFISFFIFILCFFMLLSLMQGEREKATETEEDREV